MLFQAVNKGGHLIKSNIKCLMIAAMGGARVTELGKGVREEEQEQEQEQE